MGIRYLGAAVILALGLMNPMAEVAPATEHLKQLQPRQPATKQVVRAQPKPSTNALTAGECERLGGELVEDRNCPEVRDPYHPAGKSRKGCLMRKQGASTCIDEFQ